MIEELRRAYDAAFTEERYREMLAWLDAETGFHIPFRSCETPLFLPAPLTAELERAAHEIVATVRTPEYLQAAERAVPPEARVPGEDAHTTFLQVDLALAEPDGPAETVGTVRAAAGSAGGGDAAGLVPRLVELQGFPSLYGFQWLLTRAYRRFFPVSDEMTPYFDGLDDDSYVECLRQIIVGDADPRTVVLLEVEPEQQKTRVDFALTEKLLGVPTVGLADVTVRGRQAFYRDAGGSEIPIARIYNRVIFDELARRGLQMPELFSRDLDVHWVGHPNWFWKISKFSLPFIRSAYAPPCHFLSDLREPPADLENYVLKPLFSFAGHGVEVDVTPERLRQIDRPEDYILQRRIRYGAAVPTPDVPAMAEVRMMFVWPAGGEPRLINNLVRMTKGRMVGVDFNKDRTWVGSSVALHT